MNLYPGFFAKSFRNRRDETVRGLAGSYRNLVRSVSVILVQIIKLPVKLGAHRSNHSDAVFKLGIAVVIILVRNTNTSLQIKFIGTICKPYPAPLFKLLGKRVYLSDNRRAVLRRKLFKRI